jgi:ADP-ribose pyrophosphatase YjhB (NUDIX family)
MPLSAAVEAEIAVLAERYGTPRRVMVELEGPPFDPIGQSDRYGEVCMVVRRPNGKLLAAIKTFYPPGAFRLLTGGVGHGEPIETALLREVAEETGLDVAVRCFLAVIEYQHREQHFATFAFLLDETGGTLDVLDESERIAEFREVAADELPSLAETLAQAPDRFDAEIGGRWRDWGRFRAVVHRVVYAALAD